MTYDKDKIGMILRGFALTDGWDYRADIIHQLVSDLNTAMRALEDVVSSAKTTEYLHGTQQWISHPRLIAEQALAKVKTK